MFDELFEIFFQVSKKSSNKIVFFFVNESTWRHYAWPHYGDNPF